MFLTKLDLHGFKSFVDSTEVSFGNGITAIVGPNGCGKTNISDAIRWVMGEQSAKQLRGDAMDDVIFNGSARRKPIGLAEVTLTMLNDKGILPTEYTEVEIGRRVYRSGVSEYLLNKQVVRLKDIKDLFFDTGMGSHAYSVIERSMVDNLLGDNTGHRRFLFEEASGITKYKQRKKEALNKLEATQVDLIRVTDLLLEIEKELGSLARQVAKARRHERLRGEIMDLDLRLSSLAHQGLITREKELAEDHQAESVRREAAQTELDQREAALATIKVEQIEEERTLTAAQMRLSEREAARASAQHEALVLKERGDGLSRRIVELDEQLSSATLRLTELTAREAELREQVATFEGESTARAAAKDEREAALATLEAELKTMRAEAAGVQQLALDLFQAESKARAEVERARERLSNLTERRAAAQVALATLADRLSTLAKDDEALRTELAAEEKSLAESRVRGAALQARGAYLESEGARVAEDESALRAQVAAIASRLSTLEELKRSYEGVDEAVKYALTEGRAHGAVGLVVDVLDVPGEWLEAVAGALGTALSAVVFQTQTATDNAREAMARVDKGRVSFVAIDHMKEVAELLAGGRFARHAEAAQTAGAVPLASVVTPRGTSAPIVQALLAHVFALDSDEQAAQAARAFPEFTFVSKKGTVFARGMATVGRAQDADRGLLRREHEIQSVAADKARLESKLEAATAARTKWIEERETWQQESRTHALAAEQAKERASGARARLEGLERERTQAESEQAARNDETAALTRDEATVTEQLNSLETTLAQTSGQSNAQSGEARSLEERLVEAETRREALAREAADARGHWLETTARLSSGKEELARIEVTAVELGQGRAVREGERVAALERQAETEGGRKSAESSLEGLLASEAEARAAAEDARRRTLGKREIVQAEEESLRALRHEATALAELVHTLEVQRLNARSELDRTLERLKVEYEVDLTTYEPGPWDEANRGPFDAERAEVRLSEIRGRFKALGPVNLLALEEYERKKERYDFLKTQVVDLQSARQQLLEAIEKINTTASQLFIETFAEVQKHFTDTFSTLFVGGSAELRMIGDDPLECEIDILARPRGKNLQSISLLSSGERALTAIALLFAIYLIKPSPFCLLDEVDAPLDEANVDRFVALLKRFSEKTQFIMITHNKKTMEAAAALYGVTMQEPGVSKLVSVRFDTPESRATLAASEDAAEPAESAALPALAGAEAGDTG